MPPLGPTPHYVASAVRAAQAVQRPGALDRRAPRAADRDGRPDRQVGRDLDPKGKEGLASIAASLLDEGTKTRDALQIAGELAEIGASLAAAGELESTTVSLTTLTRHLDRGLDLYADVILNPSFPEKELQRLKLQRLAQLKARADDPEQTAAAVFPRLIYGLDHPYGRPDLGTARLGPVDHARRCRGVLQADHGAGQRRARGRRRRPARSITAALEARLAAWAAGPVPQPVRRSAAFRPAAAGRST